MDQMEGWFDAELESEQDGIEQLRAADVLILGRKTYEGLAAYWPSQEDVYAELVNPMPKYVASRTITGSLTWNSQLLGADPAAEVATLKEQLRGRSRLVWMRRTRELPRVARPGRQSDVLAPSRRLGRRGQDISPWQAADSAAVDLGNDVHVRGREAVLPAAR